MTGWSKPAQVAGPKVLRPLFSHMWRWAAGVISIGAGLASILSDSGSIKAQLEPDSRLPGTGGVVRWVGVSPATDTARAIGDTIQLAVTAKDARGNALLGGANVWSSTDTVVASVDSSGTVLARSAGTASIIVTVGGKIAKSQVVVRQHPAELRVRGDSVLRVPEGERGKALAYVADPRRQRILGLKVRWRSADPSVAAVDSLGNVTGAGAGRTTLTATYESMVAQLGVDVYPVPASLTLMAGDGQRAPAGRRAPNPIAVQVVSRSGRPIEGVPVRFEVDEMAGVAEPHISASDAQGIVRAHWNLGPAPGRQSLTVSADGVANHTIVTAEAEPIPGWLS